MLQDYNRTDDYSDVEGEHAVAERQRDDDEGGNEGRAKRGKEEQKSYSSVLCTLLPAESCIKMKTAGIRK